MKAEEVQRELDRCTSQLRLARGQQATTALLARRRALLARLQAAQR